MGVEVCCGPGEYTSADFFSSLAVPGEGLCNVRRVGREVGMAKELGTGVS
jgi:hypothetical protein